MYGIDQLKARGILFTVIGETDASHIMQTQYAPEQLLRYAPLFPCYRSTARKGQSIHVEFAYLYDLANLDRRLQGIVSVVCADIEQALRAVFLADCRRANVSEHLIEAYCQTDEDFLSSTYLPDHNDLLSKHSCALSELPLFDFLNVLQLGTQQRFFRFFYERFAPQLYGRPYAPFERFLEPMRHIRNAAVHSNGLICQISEADDSFCPDLYLLSQLGQQGIGHKTLKTNMHKPVLHDLACLMQLYTTLLPYERTRDQLSAFNSFLTEHCTAHAAYYVQSPDLLSAYRFFLALMPFWENIFP